MWPEVSKNAGCAEYDARLMVAPQPLADMLTGKLLVPPSEPVDAMPMRPRYGKWERREAKRARLAARGTPEQIVEEAVKSGHGSITALIKHTEMYRAKVLKALAGLLESGAIVQITAEHGRFLPYPVFVSADRTA
jgi:hypothetical protein